MKKFLKEFKEFALKNDVVNLAVAVIMGTATSKVVSSLVDSILMPLIGILLGGKDFSSLSIQIGEASIMYGAFIQAIIDFVIIAFCVFLIVKALNKFSNSLNPKEEKKEEEKPKLQSSEEYLKEIKELLEKQQNTSSLK